MDKLFEWDVCVVQQDTFYPRQGNEQGNILSLVVRPRRESHNCLYDWLKLRSSQRKFDSTFFHHHFQPLYDDMQNEIQSFEFFQAVVLEFIDSLKNKCTKYLFAWTSFVEKFANQKHLLILPLLEDSEDSADSVLFTFRIICFIKTNEGEMLNPKNAHCSLQISP